MAELAGIPIWIWGVFMGFVLGMLALDLGVFHRKAHAVGMREALTWSAVWIGLALIFNLGIFLFWDDIQTGSAYSASEAGVAFLTGYLIEKALSVDNIFVFLVIFSYFRVPEELKHRVLFWGILGALAFRAIFIALGAAALERFTWMMIVFGLFLIGTAVKMLWAHGKEMALDRNPVVRLIRRLMPVTDDYRGQKFFCRIDGRLWATPLFVVLLVVEFTDIIFAVDSIPAIFAITQDPFLVFTSNVFAILGLRALFFALAGLMSLFRYLNYGLAGVLAFVGLKMLYGYFEKSVAVEWPKFPPALSLGVIAAILTVAMAASIKANRRDDPTLTNG